MVDRDTLSSRAAARTDSAATVSSLSRGTGSARTAQPSALGSNACQTIDRAATWYRTHVMTDGDQAPVGILLCTQKDHALVEYALAGLDNGLFVSKYLLELPRKEAMQGFIEEQLHENIPGDMSGSAT
jgi:hypothetical protein